MEIRILESQELMPALHLVWDVFVEDVAPSYTQKGVVEFQEFIKYENMNRMYQNREIIFWGAYEGTQLCGMIAVMKNGHICLFFVKKEWQGKGVGKMLYQTVYNYCAQQLRVNRLTVNAAPASVDKYRHLGMQINAPEQEVNGIRFVPMETFVTMGMVQPAAPKKSPAVIIAVTAGIILILIVLIGVFFLAHTAYYVTSHPLEEHFQDDSWEYYDEPWGDDFLDEYGDYDGYDNDPGSQVSGLKAIEAYEEPNLSYEIKEDVYEFQDEERQSTLIAFQVRFPQLSSSSGVDYTKVNEAIKKCAMATVDEIYTNPSEEVKENVLKSEIPVLVSNVNYKVCYASEGFISIAFQDEYAKGDYNLYDSNLRTINIGLKDGKIYAVGDIVNLDDGFVNEWLDEMRDEAENDAFLSELNMDEMKNALSGDSMNGIYTANFFVTDDGIEIGFDLNYPADDVHDLGYIWVTAPFDFEEIKPYITGKDFWDCLGR